MTDPCFPTVVVVLILAAAARDYGPTDTGTGKAEPDWREYDPWLATMMARRPSSCKAVSETGVNHLVKFHNSRSEHGGTVNLSKVVSTR
jgi:hypothetical protein